MPRGYCKAVKLERREKFEGQRSEWLADKEAYKARLEAQAAEANKTLGKI